MKKINQIIIRILSYLILKLDKNIVIKRLNSDSKIINAHSKLKGKAFVNRKFESINN